LFDGLRGRSPVLEQVATVFSGADRSGLTLWEISSRKKLWTVWPAGMSYVAGCAFSSDDARIATSGACFFTPKALLLDRVSGRVVASLDYRVDGRTAFGVGGGASFDPDGRFLMTGGMLLDVSGPLNKGMGPMVWRAEGVGTRKEN
jgi:hypothetical protein